MDERPLNLAARRDDAWKARHRAAWIRFNDMPAMVALERRVADAHPEQPPQAGIFAGEQLLRLGRRVGVLSGSFNPLTNAHLAVAEAAMRALQLDIVLWAIAAVTIDKERTLRASVPDRLAQLIAFAASEQRAAVALLNHGLYVDQAQAVRALIPTDANLVLLVGYDKIVQIFDPHYYTDRDAALEELFAVARLAVFPRAGAGERELDHLLSAPPNARFAAPVSYVNLPSTFAGDSSTEVRTLATQADRTGERVRALAPPEAMALIDTGPYYVGPPEADRYLWRQRWLGRLAALSGTSLARPPRLDALIARTIEQTTNGQRLRTWLTGETTSDEEARTDELKRLLRAGRTESK